MSNADILKSAKAIFWDFDGVIKDSVAAKSEAFEQLFECFGEDFSLRVKKHHESNSGISRYEKIPIYLAWSDQESTEESISKYADNFSHLVKCKVIDSAWVDGVLDYLNNNYTTQQYFIVTATPQHEIDDILSTLGIRHFFTDVIGSPMLKNDAIRMLLIKNKIDNKQSIMVGDSSTDFSAAVENSVPFVLRKTNLNKKLQKELDVRMIDSF